MLGIGAANVLLPPLVRRYFPSRIAPVTSLYLVLMSVSASTASFAAVPIAEATNWRVAFAVWIAVPVLALVPWLVLLRSARRAAVTVVEFDDGRAGRAVVTHRPVVASRVVWAITATLALSSISAYVAVAFLPGILVALAGLTPAAAGVALGVGVALGIPAALVVPLLAVRRRAVVPVIAVSGAFALVGWGGLLLAPTAAPFLWAALLGLVPITFPLSLVLVNTRTRDHRVTVSVSGFVQGVAYVSAGAFSFVVGVVHDATRAWTIPLLVLMATALLAVPATIVLARGRMVDDELESPR
jgi:CP family cyanate transporter-like MFS transporter